MGGAAPPFFYDLANGSPEGVLEASGCSCRRSQRLSYAELCLGGGREGAAKLRKDLKDRPKRCGFVPSATDPSQITFFSKFLFDVPTLGPVAVSKGRFRAGPQGGSNKSITKSKIKSSIL